MDRNVFSLVNLVPGAYMRRCRRYLDRGRPAADVGSHGGWYRQFAKRAGVHGLRNFLRRSTPCKEFKVEVNSYSAELGGSVGGVIERGDQKRHQSVAWQLLRIPAQREIRRPRLGRRRQSAVEAEQLRRHDRPHPHQQDVLLLICLTCGSTTNSRARLTSDSPRGARATSRR